MGGGGRVGEEGKICRRYIFISFLWEGEKGKGEEEAKVIKKDRENIT